MRKDIVLGVIIGFLVVGYVLRRKPCNNLLLCNASPQITLFAFDLHGVILTPDYAQIARIIWYKFPKITLIKFLLHPFELRSILQLLYNQGATEQAFDELCKRYPQLCVLKSVLVELIAAQWLNTKTINILAYLKNQGYPLVVLSNIWPSAYKLLIERYPVLSELFSGVYVPSPENNYVRKPELAYYEGFKRYLKQQGFRQHQLVFVENNYENIETAQKACLYALHVDSLNKLVQQLKAC